MKQAELTRRILQRKNRNRIFKGIFLASTLVGVVALAVLLIDILIKGAGWLTWDFITGTSSRIPEKNGIWPALIGTLWLMMITAPLTFIIGVATAIYLEEYAKDNWFSRFVQMNISNLAGVPSIVYGLLGLTVFVRVMHFGNSILSGALTLTLLVLPILIVSAQEAIRAVPVSQRQASYALGANKWQTVTKVVLPSALPGILTGSILALSRAIGETAPIIAIGAVSFTRAIPQGLLDSFTALPIQIFSWSGMPNPKFENVAAAGIIVLLIVLLGMNAIAILLRNKYQKR
ncbi:phosphate ABC transporter permease PstA [Insulibacter thermoxylanivorax]|uniref:Phosphate transport system permease protein PstA n=1 Tax=Insulibacter thermoxylanivorax TaxID=2749268 RepID=A0A916QFF2_9BACL|nr:phosphate ABC transporter permease PstA [Insulibacter thermoxylanivorax]GFR38073.1 phosphate ABC transporter permease PstA [Insulibacter thermoxylanivorax]